MIKSENELELMADDFAKRDNTVAENVLNTIELSLTREQADKLIKLCKECYKTGAKDMADVYENDRKDFQNGVVKDVSKYAEEIVQGYKKELFENRVITTISVGMCFVSMLVAVILQAVIGG